MLERTETEMACSVIATQYDIRALLEMAGVRIRGRNRADCLRCGRFRSLSFTEEVFFCHGIDCGWKGNAVTLQKELGVYRRIPSAEYRELYRQRERAHDAAARLYGAVRARRMVLLDLLHDFSRLEALAHDAGPDDEAAWDGLALVYAECPEIEGELDFIESASAAELLEHLVGRREVA